MKCFGILCFALLVLMPQVCRISAEEPRTKILELENGKRFENPTAQEIDGALRMLDGYDNKFAAIFILEAPDTYIQTYLDIHSPGMILEYQIDSKKKHYQAVEPQLSIDQVITAFQLYQEDDPGWVKCCTWYHMSPEELENPSGE